MYTCLMKITIYTFQFKSKITACNIKFNRKKIFFLVFVSLNVTVKFYQLKTSKNKRNNIVFFYKTVNYKTNFLF